MLVASCPPDFTDNARVSDHGSYLSTPGSPVSKLLSPTMDLIAIRTVAFSKATKPFRRGLMASPIADLKHWALQEEVN